MFCSCKFSQIPVHTVLWKIYNKYCLTVCSKNYIKYLFKCYIFYHIYSILMYAWTIIPVILLEEDLDDWKLCSVFPDDVIIQLIFDWLGGIVHVWFDKVVDCVMCHLLLPLIYVREIWSWFHTGLSYKGKISLVWIPIWKSRCMYMTESNVKTCTSLTYYVFIGLICYKSENDF